ncbi:MAG: DUF6169 family protein [Saprospiraceae bacterium]
MYPLQPLDPNSYSFNTNTGALYVIRFTPAFTKYAPECTLRMQVEEVAFGLVAGIVPRHDKEICETISDSVFSRCLEKVGAVIFICDSSDDRQRHRAITFRNWNSRFNSDGNFIFLNTTIEAEDGMLYVGIIIARDNPQAQKFVDEFDYMVDKLSNYQI